MKQIIKVKVLTEGCEPYILGKGDWIDLKAAEDTKIELPTAGLMKRHNIERRRDVTFTTALIPLGVVIKLPKGMEAIVVPRSSSFKQFGFLQTNSVGVIDNTYSGPTDEWKMPILAIKDAEIFKGERICQFRIQPSQKATLWQKLKWLFSNGVKIKYVNDVNSPSRGGFGSTGK